MLRNTSQIYSKCQRRLLVTFNSDMKKSCYSRSEGGGQQFSLISGILLFRASVWRQQERNRLESL